MSLSTLFATTTFAQKADVFAPFKARIKTGCIKSMSNNSSRHQICECIAARHITSAKKDTNRQAELMRLQWTVEYYETQNEDQAQKLIDAKPSYSDLDFQIVDMCY